MLLYDISNVRTIGHLKCPVSELASLCLMITFPPVSMNRVSPGGFRPDPASRAISALLLRLHDSELVLETQLAVVTPPMVSQPIRTVLETTPAIPPQGVCGPNTAASLRWPLKHSGRPARAAGPPLGVTASLPVAWPLPCWRQPTGEDGLGGKEPGQYGCPTTNAEKA